MKFTTRSQAMRSLRQPALAVFAMGLAADQASREQIAASIPPARRARYMEKMHGYNTAAMWSEAVRQWAGRIPNSAVRIHEPYRWTELVIAGNHVRFERDDRPISSGRQESLHQQASDVLPGIDEPDPTVVYLVMTLSELSGLPTGLRIKAPLGKTTLWSPIRISRAEGMRQLESWRRRDVAFLRDMQSWAERNVSTPATTSPTAPAVVLPATTVKPTIRPGRRASEQGRTADEV